MTASINPIQRKAHAFVRSVLELIRQEPDFNTALPLATWLARYLWENCCGIYRLDELEEILLSKLPPHLELEETSSKDELHVASVVLRTGGHTQVMKSLIKHADNQPDALLTRQIRLEEAADILEIPHERIHLPPPSTDKKPELIQIAKKISEYQNIILHIHPDDIICALAARLIKSHRPDITIALLNHADHVFSVGIGASDKVFEISGYGWQLRKKRQIENRSTFVGIPISNLKGNKTTNEEAQYALSGGTAFKYRPARNKSLPPIITKLLSNHQNLTIKVIGPKSTEYWWWPTQIKLDRRVRILKSIPRPEYFSLLDNCTFYIDSYPLTGGTAFPEALMRGCNVAGLGDGATGYSCADALRSNSIPAFLRSCQLLLEQDPFELARQENVRKQCITLHDPVATRKRMEKGFNRGCIEEPPPAMLSNQAGPTVEQDWIDKAISIIPPIKNIKLPPLEAKLILRAHAQHFGLLNKSTLKIAFNFLIKKNFIVKNSTKTKNQPIHQRTGHHLQNTKLKNQCALFN